MALVVMYDNWKKDKKKMIKKTKQTTLHIAPFLLSTRNFGKHNVIVPVIAPNNSFHR